LLLEGIKNEKQEDLLEPATATSEPHGQPDHEYNKLALAAGQ
jgi:hypothetical protein